MKMLILNGYQEGEVFDIPAGDTILGRNIGLEDTNNCSVNLHYDESISRRHVRLINNDWGCIAEDLHSACGTYINGIRIEGTHEVAFGDVIKIGQTLLLLCVENRPDPCDYYKTLVNPLK